MTLLEAMVAMSMAGIVLTATVRGAAQYRDRLAVEQAQQAILGGYRRAQAAARAWGRPAELVIATDSIVVRSMGATDTVELFRAPGPSLKGVLLAPASHRAIFASSGLAMGAANITHAISKGATQRAVVVSRLGRVVLQ